MKADNEAKQAVWKEAEKLWLSRQNSRNTAQSYHSSLNGLLGFCGKAVWEISRKDIAAWLADLHQAGRSDATIASRISGIKSFYNFVIREYVTLDMDGEEYRLREDNPAASFKLPKVERYGKAMCWDEEQAGAFLRAINTDNLPGLRNSELRQLQYEDLEVLPGGIVIMRYQGKGKGV